MRSILILSTVFFSASIAIQCYNGMKLVRGQSVGQGSEDCPSASYCYNMTASALILVDVVKAGCSTWRCMLARDKCISTTFQMIPVSLCCCSTDRCNVGENSIGWDPNYNQNGGSGGFGNNNNFNNNNNNNNNNYNGFEQSYKDNTQNGGGMQNLNFGQNWASAPKNNNNNKKPAVTREDVERAFKMDVDTTTPRPTTHSSGGGGGDIEEEFVRKEASTPRPRQRTQSGGNTGGSSNDEIIL